MSTSSHSTALNAHTSVNADREPVGLRLRQLLSTTLKRIRAAAEEYRVRQHLATLPDSMLRDIGIAEDEIHRIRACERFTPRAWAERMGTHRQPWDL